VMALRRDHPVFRRRRFFRGDPLPASGVKDVSWIRPDGRELEPADWSDPESHLLGMLVPGDATDDPLPLHGPDVGSRPDDRAEEAPAPTLLLLLNSGPRSRYFSLPEMAAPGRWRQLLDTAHGGTHALRDRGVNLAAHSLILLRHENAS